MTEEKFWSRVDQTDSCWLWQGQKTSAGYGLFYLGAGKRIYAHRMSWQLHHGQEIPSGMVVDHRTTCPKSCVNPDHLRLATLKQNAENTSRRGRCSKSGVRGVYYNNGTWMARIQHDNQDVYVGNFPTIEAAEHAVVAKRNELFTHNDEDRM